MIHILGLGAIGGLVGHELVQAHHPVTYLLRNAKRLENFKSGKLVLNRVQNSQAKTSVSSVNCTTQETIQGGIKNLVVATKAYHTAEALAPYVKHLSNDSNILFIHNGMGVIEECMDKNWHNLQDRPNIYKAIVTHGAYKTSPNVVNHVGLGKMVIAGMGTEEQPEFIKNITEIPNLNAKFVSYNQFLMEEIDKLVVNACINPMTALMDCLNGDLLKGGRVLDIFDSIIWEAVAVIKKEYLVVLRAIPEASTLLDRKRLLSVVLDVINVTKLNSSSMREDIHSLNKTEIDYINGYVVRLGRKHGVNAHTNRMMSNMVKTKHSIEKGLEREAAEVLMGR